MADMKDKVAASPSNKEGKKEPEAEVVPFTTLYCSFGVTALNQCMMFIYYGSMPFLFKQYGTDPVSYGYIMSTFLFLQLCFSPIIGNMADSYGARQAMILCTLGMSAAHLTMGIANGLPLLCLSRAFAVIFDAVPPSQMLVTDITPASERAKYLSKSVLPNALGMILGPTIGGFLSKYLGSQGTLMITWMLPLLSLIPIMALIPAVTKKPSAKPTENKAGGVNWGRLRELFAVGDIPFLLVIRCLSTLPGMLFVVNFQLAGVTYFKLTPQGNGMVVSALGICNMLNNWYVLPYLNHKFESNRLMRAGPVISVVVYFLLSQTTEVWQLVALLYPLNLCYAIMDNQVMTRLTKSVDSTDTSTMVGIGTMLLILSRTLSPTVGGMLMQQFGWPALGSLGFAVSILMTSVVFTKSL